MLIIRIHFIIKKKLKTLLLENRKIVFKLMGINVVFVVNYLLLLY